MDIDEGNGHSSALVSPTHRVAGSGLQFESQLLARQQMQQPARSATPQQTRSTAAQHTQPAQPPRSQTPTQSRRSIAESQTSSYAGDFKSDTASAGDRKAELKQQQQQTATCDVLFRCVSLNILSQRYDLILISPQIRISRQNAISLCCDRYLGRFYDSYPRDVMDKAQRYERIIDALRGMDADVYCLQV